MTLFLGEAFVEFTNNVAPSKLGGPNGITGIDPIQAFGVQLLTNTSYYYLLVIVLVVTMAVLRLLEYSRTGRAWRAVREDPLAAAAMTIPVNRVKLSAFACAAMVAALAGTIFAAQQTSVFPTDFDTPILILIYAGLILGGTGSIAGAATGALVVMVIYDGLLRSPAEASLLFYGLGPADPAGQAAPVAQAGRGSRQRPSRSASRRTRSPRPSRPARSRPGRNQAAGSATGCATG